MAGHSPAAFTWSNAQAGARAFSPLSDPLTLLGGGMAVADFGVVVASSFCAFLLRHGPTVPPTEIASITLLAAVLTVNVMRLASCYDKHVTGPLAVQITRAARSWSIVPVMLVIFAYLTKTSDEFSRLWAISWYVEGLIGLALIRLIAHAKVARWRQQGKLARTVAVVDLTGNGEALARRVQRGGGSETRLVGVFARERTEGRRNGVADLMMLARLFRIDEVIVTISGHRQDAAAESIIRKLGTLPANVRLCPEIPEMTIAPRKAGLLYGQPMLTVYHQPMVGWNWVAKRTEDLVLSALLLILLAPLLISVAILIKSDSPGPVLFRQKRAGFNNNVLVVYKFRTMLHQPAPETGVPQARRNDPRVTRVGRFLRRSSIDELPQLINVLQGGMSLVGPRPHAIAHNDQYAALIDDYLGRHRVQPGITGWAQVNGLRGETDTLDKMQRRIEHDLAYIDRWSLLLDIRILFLTVFLTVFDRNAY